MGLNLLRRKGRLTNWAGHTNWARCTARELSCPVVMQRCRALHLETRCRASPRGLQSSARCTAQLCSSMHSSACKALQLCTPLRCAELCIHGLSSCTRGGLHGRFTDCSMVGWTRDSSRVGTRGWQPFDFCRRVPIHELRHLPQFGDARQVPPVRRQQPPPPRLLRRDPCLSAALLLLLSAVLSAHL